MIIEAVYCNKCKYKETIEEKGEWEGRDVEMIRLNEKDDYGSEYRTYRCPVCGCEILLEFETPEAFD